LSSSHTSDCGGMPMYGGLGRFGKYTKATTYINNLPSHSKL